MKDVLGALEVLLGYAGLRLEGDVLLMLERGANPGERVRALSAADQSSGLFIRALTGTGADQGIEQL